MLRALNAPIFDLWLLRVLTGISAFLLFQIELIIAKIFLPHYGGSYLVWGACVVFFQAALLAGYVFAHGLIQRYGMRRYCWAHLVLVFLPLLFFPGRPLIMDSGGHALPLALDVFLRLCVTIGPVFFVLSTVSITSQMWLSSSSHGTKFNPYALYAASNLGSFLALLSYPFVFEAYWDITQQLKFWTVLYFMFVGLNVWVWQKIRVKEKAVGPDRTDGEAGSFRKAQWFLLGLAGVMMFLSVNNIITNEIVPVPLLWIMPLGLYLLSFVLNFREMAWCPSWIIRHIPFWLGIAGVMFFLVEEKIFPIPVSLVLLCGIQFILCMYCQNRLIALRPRDDRHLTFFYVMFSFGGFVGGVLTTWVIPVISYSIIEYLVGLVVIAATLVLEERKFSLRWRHALWIAALVTAVITWPTLYPRYNVWCLLMVLMLFRLVFCFVFKGAPAAVVLTLVILTGMAYYPLDQFNASRIVQIKRNYYGISKVLDSNGIRSLVHGETLHGAQYLAQDKRNHPLTYYSLPMPIGEILSSDVFSFSRVGLVGLGTGALSAYGKPRQIMDFYELDPDMNMIANRHFTYLRDSAAKINFIVGDARLSLEKNKMARYDLLIVDAFGGDSIPFHLLTQEAISLYRERLNSAGMLVFHVSNRYLELRSVLANAGASLGAHVGFKVGKDSSLIDIVSTWVVITWDDVSFATLRSGFGWTELTPDAFGKTRLWTDRYINILPVIKFQQFLESIKSFKPFSW